VLNPLQKKQHSFPLPHWFVTGVTGVTAIFKKQKN